MTGSEFFLLLTAIVIAPQLTRKEAIFAGALFWLFYASLAIMEAIK